MLRNGDQVRIFRPATRTPAGDETITIIKAQVESVDDGGPTVPASVVDAASQRVRTQLFEQDVHP